LYPLACRAIPAEYQIDVLESFMDARRFSLRGPRGLGKTALSAWIIHWFALTRDGRDWKIPTTASSWTQLTKFLWPEVHKWARFLDWEKIGRPPYDKRNELLMLNLRLETGEAFAVAHENSDLIEGAHADHLLFLFDEAKSIKDSTFDSAEGSLSAAGSEEVEAFSLAVSTPGEPLGRFYDIHKRKPGYEDWHVRKVTKDEAIAAGRITEAWAVQRAKQWGVTSALYLNHVEGEFAASDEDGVIPLAWIEAAVNRWHAWEQQGFPGLFTGVGVDVGGGGEGADKTTLTPCYDYLKIKEVRRLDNGDPNTWTMEVAGYVAGIINAHNQQGVAIVDAIGIGAGVIHRLVEMRDNALPFIASAKTEFRDHSKEFGFANWRAAGWWTLREMLEPGSGFEVCLPPDDDMIGELTAPHYKVTSTSLIQVEEKVTIRKRLGRSTDCADAIIHIIVGPMLLDERDVGTEVTYSPIAIGPNY